MAQHPLPLTAMAQKRDCSDIQWRMSLQSPHSIPQVIEMIMHEQVGIHPKCAIIVDADAATSELLAELLESAGFAPFCYQVRPISLDFIEQMQPQLLILELGLGDPRVTLDLLGEMRRNPLISGLSVIVNSTDDRLLARLAEPLRALGCVVLAKPFVLDDFFSSIRLCLNSSYNQTRRLACCVRAERKP